MLLHCPRKKKMGPHFQLPGGHVDEHEFLAAGKLPEFHTTVDETTSSLRALHC
jgi:hypothetical protein